MRISRFITFSSNQRQELFELAQNVARIDDELLALQVKVQQQAQQLAMYNAAGVSIVQAPNQTYDLSTSITLGFDDLNTVHNIDVTGTRTVTLPVAMENCWINFYNGGSGTLAISDGTNTLCTLTTNAGCDIKSWLNSDGIAVWPTKVDSMSRDGKRVVVQDVIINSTSVGVIQKDTGGHYWRTAYNTSGALVTSDLGTAIAVVVSDIGVGAP